MDSFGGPLPLLTYAQFQSALRIEFGRARRYGIPLSCVLFGVDRLDELRDAVGVGARDQVMARLVVLLQGQVRGSDLIAHYNDRLVLLLPHTAAVGARAVAERFLAAVRGEAFAFEGSQRRFTAAAGIAVLESKATLFFDSLQKSAESALTQATAGGGDRVVIAGGIR